MSLNKLVALGGMSLQVQLLLVLTVISPPLHHLQENLFFVPVDESSESVHPLFASPSLFFLFLVKKREKSVLLWTLGSVRGWCRTLQMSENQL